MRKINEIIIHHSQNKNSYEDIKRLHMILYGWDDIGYHLLIDKKGKLLKGRPLEIEGAHVLGYNKNTIGICLIGNFDLEKPKEEQITKLIEVLKVLKKKFKIPNEGVKGHREFNPVKSCPGKNVSIEEIKKQLG